MTRGTLPDKSQLTEWGEAWTAFLRDGKGGITRANYGSYARKIDAFRAEHGIDRPDDFTDALEGEFIDQFPVDTTRWTYQKALRAFFNWCEKHGKRSVVIKSARVKLQQRPPAILTAEQINEIRKLASPRDKVLLRFIFETAVRASEARYAEINNYNRVTHIYSIVETKTNKFREARLTEDFARELNHYIDHVRPPQKGDKPRIGDTRRPTRQKWLFLTNTLAGSDVERDYAQLTKSGLASIFTRLRLDMEWERGTVSAQMLRRGRATELAAITRDTHHLMGLIGWKDTRSVSRYLAGSPERDQAIIDEAERRRSEPI